MRLLLSACTRVHIGHFCMAMMLVFPALAWAENQPPFITTPAEVVERMLSIAGIKADDFVIDLGSGDGRIVITAAKQFGARGLGVDLNARLVKLSQESAEREGVAQRVTFEMQDVLRTDISRASVVTLYLLPGLLERLKDKLLTELKPGARIVSHSFIFISWHPDRSERVRLQKPHPGQGDESMIHLWIVPAEVRGAWRATSPEAGNDWRLRIHQNFQDIEVEATSAGKAITVREARLTGDRIEWSGMLEGTPVHYLGRVSGKRIEGEIALGKGAQPRPLSLERIR